MTRGFRRSQATLHTWSGLLVGWVLFIVFIAGTTAYWREALNRWAQPELARIDDPARVLRGGQAYLARHAPDAVTWFITVPTARSAGGQLFWQARPGKDGRVIDIADTSALIDADGRPVVARRTLGGDFFYRFHFDLHYLPVIWARWIVGVSAMFMLVAILTGIVTHKKIFRDFFTLRRGRGQRSWLDGHNAAAVLGLPFHLMITYTGLVTLMAMLMPWAVVANYTSPTALYDTLYPQAPPAARTGHPARLADIAALMADAERRVGGPIGYIAVAEPGDAAARITFTRSTGTTLSAYGASVAYDGQTGRAIWQSPAPGGATVTAGAMVGLHAGRYADAALRWVYFLAGIGGSLMVASGLVLWTVKRREKLPDPTRPPVGFRVVERLNIGVVAGFPLSMTGFLWANRLLPTGMAGRADAEVNTMFLLWGAALLHAAVRRPSRAWVEQLGLAAAALTLLPPFDIIATERGIPRSIASGDWTLAGVDITFLVLGPALGWAARRVHRHRPAVRPARGDRPPAPASLAPAE